MTKIESTIRTRMHWAKLSAAAKFGYLPREWPVTRCAICGKLYRPDKHSYNYLITQVRLDDECPLYSICRDHGGENGKDYFDAQTGCKVHVGPSPYFMRKVISDWLREGAYWALVLLRYGWYTVNPALYAVRHPVSFFRYLCHKKKIDSWFGGEPR